MNGDMVTRASVHSNMFDFRHIPRGGRGRRFFYWLVYINIDTRFIHIRTAAARPYMCRYGTGHFRMVFFKAHNSRELQA